MKKNFKESERFLASQDKAFQERMEFIKSQGEFFGKVLCSLEKQRQKYQFIIDNFYQSAVQLPNLYKNAVPQKEAAEEIREWPRLSLLQSTKQLMTQDQIRTICNSITDYAFNNQSGELYEYAIIEFKEGHLTWHEMTFLRSHSVVTVEITPELTESFDLPMGIGLDATIYMHVKNGYTQAFLKAIGTDGKEYFFQLNHFSILFLLDEDSRDLDEDRQKLGSYDKEESDGIPVEGEKEEREIGMFTLFNKAYNLMFVSTY